MVDRYKDIIKSGGEKVSSIRVEALLHEHPQVARAAVIGLPHDRWGEAVTAVVVRQPGATVTEDELVEWARTRLAGFETPKAVVFADTLPETVGGKVLKYRLRRAMAELYRDAATSAAGWRRRPRAPPAPPRRRGRAAPPARRARGGAGAPPPGVGGMTQGHPALRP